MIDRAGQRRVRGPDFLRALALMVMVILPLGVAAQDETGLRVGIYQNEPKLFIAEDGTAQGFFPMLIAELAARIGRPVTYVSCEWAACMEALAAGELDVMPDVAHSAERATRVRFGHEAALHAVSYLYARESGGVNELADLHGRRLAVVADSIQYDHIRDFTGERGWRVELVEVTDMQTVLEDVANGSVEFGVVNDYFGNRLAPALGLYRTRFVLQPRPLFFAYRPDMDPGFVARIDAELAALKAAPDSAYYEAG